MRDDEGGQGQDGGPTDEVQHFGEHGWAGNTDLAGDAGAHGGGQGGGRGDIAESGFERSIHVGERIEQGAAVLTMRGVAVGAIAQQVLEFRASHYASPFGTRSWANSSARLWRARNRYVFTVPMGMPSMEATSSYDFSCI